MAPQRSAVLDVVRLWADIRTLYSLVASDERRGLPCHRGFEHAVTTLGYDRAALRTVPKPNVASFAGVGNPFAFGLPRTDATVLDIGSGAGMDALLAALAVGPGGRAIGVDMTEAMDEKARAGARAAQLDWCSFEHGMAEELPVRSGSVDVVISNGVICLAAEKPRVFAEIARVLKRGGRVQISDVVVGAELSAEARADTDLWTRRIAGALEVTEYLDALGAAGFIDAGFGASYEAFRGTSTEPAARSAQAVGTDFFARKPG